MNADRKNLLDYFPKGKKYGIIYADPPWRYQHSVSPNRAIENHYPTMSMEELKALPVSEIAKENSALFLWSTSPLLPEAIEIIKAWGFVYRTNAVWDKKIIGMGYWFRQQHELLLIGKRGKFSSPSEQMRIPSVLRVKRGKHSEKPAIIRQLLSTWYPNEEKIELFSRDNFNGWDCWGNEITDQPLKNFDYTKVRQNKSIIDYMT